MPIQIDNSNAFTVTLAAPTSGSASLTFPINAGASTNTLITDGSGGLSWGAIPSGSVTGFVGSANTTGTNATKAVDALSIDPTGALTNQDIALIPKGNGSLVAGGGVATAYGTYNTCMQYQGGDASKVAQGNNNVILGGNSTSTGSSSTYNVALGNNNGSSITGSSNILVGSYGMAVSGDYNSVYGAINSTGLGGISSKNYCTVTPGRNPRTDFNYQHVMSGTGYDPNNNGNSSRYFLFHLLNTTTNATPTRLFTNGASGSASTANDNFNVLTGGNAVIGFWGYVVAVTTSGAAAYAWNIFYGAKCNGVSNAGFTISGSVTAEGGDASLSTCVVTVTADTTNNNIAVTVTGLAATSINWVAQIQAIRMGGF
jgi:hypothetical protein